MSTSLGKEGVRLRQLENEFGCRIRVPQRERNINAIWIYGPPAQAELAAQRIREFSADAEKMIEKRRPSPVKKTFKPRVPPRPRANPHTSSITFVQTDSAFGNELLPVIPLMSDDL